MVANDWERPLINLWDLAQNERNIVQFLINQQKPLCIKEIALLSRTLSTISVENSFPSWLCACWVDALEKQMALQLPYWPAGVKCHLAEASGQIGWSTNADALQDTSEAFKTEAVPSGKLGTATPLLVTLYARNDFSPGTRNRNVSAKRWIHPTLYASRTNAIPSAQRPKRAECDSSLIAKSCLLDFAGFGDFAIITKETPTYLVPKHLRQMLHHSSPLVYMAVTQAPRLNLGQFEFIRWTSISQCLLVFMRQNLSQSNEPSLLNSKVWC